MTKSDRHSISPRLAGGEVCKERLRGGGGGTIIRTFIASPKFFSFPIVYFSVVRS